MVLFVPGYSMTPVLGCGRRHPNDTTIDKNGNFRYYPGTAEKWAVSKDKRTVFIKLNPQARYSDGTKVTSDDMMFSFYFWQSENIKAPWYNNNFRRNYSAITKYDEHHFAMSVPEAKAKHLCSHTRARPHSNAFLL